MSEQPWVTELKTTKKFFDRTTEVLTEDDAGFAPAEGMMTAAAQIAHVARTVEWFLEAGFRDHWDTNFEQHMQEATAVQTLSEARAWNERAFEQAVTEAGSKSQEYMMTPMPINEFMPGAPRIAIISGIADHTAHHRGALSVYARLRGKTPPIPYF